MNTLNQVSVVSLVGRLTYGEELWPVLLLWPHGFKGADFVVY